MIKFTQQAREKFELLRMHHFSLSKEQVVETVSHPEVIDHSRSPLRLAQRPLDPDHVLRVVYREEGDDKIIVTFYLGRRKQYEKERKPKISYEPEADVIRMELGNLPIDYATEFGNVVVHFSPDNVPVYVEFLEASKFMEEISKAVKNPTKGSVRSKFQGINNG